MRVYLAGAIDSKDRTDAQTWRERAAYLLQGQGIAAVCPLRDGAKVTTGSWTEGGRSLGDSEWIVKKDIELIDASDVVLANLGDWSVGTFMEIFHAWRSGKAVVAYGLLAEFEQSAFLKAMLSETHFLLMEAIESLARRNSKTVYLEQYRKENIGTPS